VAWRTEVEQLALELAFGSHAARSEWFLFSLGAVDLRALWLKYNSNPIDYG
jgi:hypothetical protein